MERARKLAAEGKAIKEIAAILDCDAATVRGWVGKKGGG
jgi:transposase